MMWIHQELRSGWECTPLLLTSQLGERATALTADGDIIDIEYSAGATHLPNVPGRYRGIFLACDQVRQLLLALDPLCVWRIEGRHELSINTSLAQRLHASGKDYWPLKDHPWRMGGSFLSTAIGAGFDQDEKRIRGLLRACADTILGENLAATHALRQGPQGSQNPLVRATDSAKAMRRDIDYEFHLHYWDTPTGPELASVVAHDDFSIPPA